MIEKLLALLGRCDSFILTTHDPADADGIGAQMVVACILKDRGKRFRVINSSPLPDHFRFMDRLGVVEQWDSEGYGSLPEHSALIVVDTAEESQMGQMRELIGRAREVFAIDHHEPKPGGAMLEGICDPTAASTCELAVELALAAGSPIDPDSAFAAYVGIVYDTGFFAYPKVSRRTFAAAQELVKLGADPNDAYRRLCENSPARSLYLQQKAVASLTLHWGNRVAVQKLRREDFAETGAFSEDTDGFVNFPLRIRDVCISFMIKETPEGKVSCSLRSKGALNVAKIAGEFGGGGHFNASGFRSGTSVDDTVAKTLARLKEALRASEQTEAQ